MTTTLRRRRLIEVAFPMEEVSADSAPDRNRGSPHPQTLHRWWARRPLAACRAFIYASLVDDPDTDSEREALLREVADLAMWKAVRHPEAVVRVEGEGGSGLTGAELLKRARQRILECNDGKPPKLLDPFAGGGSIPLEALRLGCEVEASDLNPVAVLILKGTVEYPQKYGQPNSRPVPDYILQADQGSLQKHFFGGDPAEAYRRNPLAADVRYWGNWMLERAREELAEFYPPDPDGSVPVAYLWSRTIPCPSCHAEMPLIRQYWLARRSNKRVALQPVIDRENRHVDFQIAEETNVAGDPAEATTSRGDTKCLLCGQVVKASGVHEAGRTGRMSTRPTTVVTVKKGVRGKSYRKFSEEDSKAFRAAETRLSEISTDFTGNYPIVPDEPLAYHPQYMLVREYGLDQWGKLFNSRQLMVLTTFSKALQVAYKQMLASGLEVDYAAAVATYLGLAISRLTSEHCTLVRWNPVGEKAQGALALQALPMVWDFAELNPWGDTVGDARTAVDMGASVVRFCGGTDFKLPAQVVSRDARVKSDASFQAVITDPPYYDSLNYADLADFYYVWLKRSLGFLYPDLTSMPLSPKREQIVMNVYASRGGAKAPERKRIASEAYVLGMREASQAITASLQPEGIQGMVFAHTDPDAWATLIEGLLAARLVPTASWPIDTEMRAKLSASAQARLKTSVWMACRKREGEAGDAFLGDVMGEMRPVIRDRLLYFWSKGIRGADFFISAIGPALSVFGRYQRVMRPDGTQVTVRDFLDMVRRESTTVALEQVLHGADLGVIDPVTRQYVTWAWSYSKTPLDAGEAIALCLATGASYDDTTRPHSITAEKREKSKKVVQLRSIRQRAMEDDDLGYDTAARPAPLIDQLHHAAWLWGQNQASDLGTYMGRLGEARWTALQTLGQAVAECLPEGDEDRRIILGLLGSNVMASTPANGPHPQHQGPAGAQLPGFEDSQVHSGGG